MVFPVVMYECESWTIKKAEHRRIDTFQLWCWRRILRVPQTARRFNQSILKETSPEYSLEGPMLKLKLQYFVYLMRWLDGITGSMDMSFEQTPGGGEGQGSLASYSPWSCRVRHDLVTEPQKSIMAVI